MEFNGTFLATIISFIVFVFLMNKILYVPILGIMEERKSFIDSNYKDAENNRLKADKLTEEKNEKLNLAKDEARDKYLETIEGYKAQRTEKLSEADRIAAEELETSKAELAKLSDEVKDALKNSMSNLANDIVEKIIGYKSDIEGFDNETVSSVLWGEGK